MDAVVNLAFSQDMSKFAQSSENEVRATPELTSSNFPGFRADPIASIGRQTVWNTSQPTHGFNSCRLTIQTPWQRSSMRAR